MSARTVPARPTARLLGSFGVKGGAARWSALLTPACEVAGITTDNRLAMFLANVHHETGGFGALTENLNYSAAALLSTFGRHRISEADAMRLGRKPGEGPLSEERQREIAIRIYGGEWGRRNLGNLLPDDGWTFRGRGLMQLTGRANVTRFAQQIGRVPDDAFLAWIATPEGAVASACAFWSRSGCNALADAGEIEEVRRLINGGTFGLDEVRTFYFRLHDLIRLDRMTPAVVSLLR